jgi:hypothetical protein
MQAVMLLSPLAFIENKTVKIKRNSMPIAMRLIKLHFLIFPSKILNAIGCNLFTLNPYCVHKQKKPDHQMVSQLNIPLFWQPSHLVSRSVGFPILPFSRCGIIMDCIPV